MTHYHVLRRASIRDNPLRVTAESQVVSWGLIDFANATLANILNTTIMNDATKRTGPVTQAVILAGGKGERLHPLTAQRPKVMLPIANRPILEHVINALVANNITDLVIVVGYRHEMVQDYFGSGERFGCTIRFVHQEHQLGTGHALLTAHELLGDNFLVVPGDNIITESIVKRIAYASADTMLITDQASGHQYGVVEVSNGLATRLVEKPLDHTSPWVSTGGFLLSRNILDYLEGELDLPAAVNKAINDGREMRVEAIHSGWWDAVYPWDLLKLNGNSIAQCESHCEGVQEEGAVVKGPVHIGLHTVLRANTYVMGPVVIGEGCEIGPNVVIFPYTSIGDNTVIEPFTNIRNSLVGSSVQIGSHSHIADSVVLDGCSLGPRLTAPSKGVSVGRTGDEYTVQVGAILAENVIAGAGVSVRPGITIGHGAQIRDMATVTEDVQALRDVL